MERCNKLSGMLDPAGETVKSLNTCWHEIKRKEHPKRLIAKEILIMWCAAIAEGRIEGRAFGLEWGFTSSVGKKRNVAYEDEDADSDEHYPLNLIVPIVADDENDAEEMESGGIH